MGIFNLLIAGDLCPRLSAEDLYDKAEEITKEVRGIVKSCDAAMVNIETVYSEDSEPIKKSGPNLKSKPETVSFVKGFGFDIAACANNHMGDYGEKGIVDTLKTLKTLGLQTVGAGENEEEAQKPLYIERNGVKLAIVNCAEHEFGIAEKKRAGMAGMDYYATSHIIKTAKENADKVILFMHGGNETNPVPRKGMIKMCHFFAECGADAIVLSHAHCPQGFEIYNGVPIYYGTGNFYMAAKEPNGMWEYGYMVLLKIEKDKPIKAEMIPYHQTFDGSEIHILKNDEKDRFLKYIDCISGIISKEKLYDNMTLAWAKRYMEEMADFEERGSKAPDSEHTLYIRNSYTCESHAELMATFYKAYCENALDGLEKYDEYIKKLQNYELPDFCEDEK